VEELPPSILIPRYINKQKGKANDPKIQDRKEIKKNSNSAHLGGAGNF